LLRLVAIAALIYAGKTWGVPLYNQYFTHEKQQAFMPTSEVQEGPFTVSFHEMGSLEAQKSSQVLTHVDGKIVWLVQDGITVKKGDRIAELDAAPLKTALNAANLAYESAKSNVGKAEEGVRIYKLQRQTDLEKSKVDYDLAKDQSDLAKEQLDKKISLAKDKLVSEQDVIQAKMDCESKQMDLLKRDKDLAFTKAQVESDIKLKSRDVDEAKITVTTRKTELDEAQKKVQQAVITADDAGLVILADTWRQNGRSKVMEGDAVYPNYSLCMLPDLSHMQVKLNLGETDAARVVLGMKALIRMDAVPNRIFHGTVKKIDSLAKPGGPWGEGGQKKIDVIVDMKEADPRILKPGMTADVEFVSKQVAKVLYTPIESVIDKEGKTFVYVKDGKSYRRVVVKTGIFNDTHICITGQMKKGQVVALRDPTRSLDAEMPGVTDTNEGKKQKSPPIPGAKK
jgi:multidrug efflux pump subunit AcrA (membrane-fusion protein)